MSAQQPQVYRVFPSVVAPIVLSAVAAYFGFARDYWLLCSIPFIVLGSICAAPNLNLADGCLVVVSIVLGGVLAVLFFRTLGVAIISGSIAGWIGGAIEKNIRMRPA